MEGSKRPTVTGTMTFDTVQIEQASPGLVTVTGNTSGSETVLEAPESAVTVGELSIVALDDTITLGHPDEDVIWVDVTDTKLAVTTDRPD